jgi:MFS transporter, DHA2 family, multidrug resistance protein
MAAAAVSSASAEHGPPTHKWLIAIAVMLGCALEVLDTTIVNVALPHMQGSFSASVDEIAWVLTSYLVANGIMIPMTGWISARFGRKRYFLFSVMLFVIASSLCGAARSLDQMVIFRLIQGAAGAAMIPSSQAIMMESFPPREQQMAMAMWGMGLMVAPIAGPSLGGWITDNLNWRWNFYINIPIGILAFLMVSTFVHDPAYLRTHRAREGKVDYLGITFLILSLGLGQIVLDRGQRADWFASGWVLWGTALSLLFGVLLVVQELRFPDPIIELRILKRSSFSLSVIMVVAMSFTLYGTGLLNPIFLQDYMSYDAWKAGLVLGPRGFGTMFSMMMVGQLARRGHNTRSFVGVGFLMMALGLWSMSRWNLSISMWDAIWPGIVMGVGMGLIFPTLSATAIASVARERMGYAASLYNMVRNMGAAIGISYLTTMLIDREQTHQSYLVEHLSVFDVWRMSQTPPKMPGGQGFSYMPHMIDGQHQNFGMLYGLIQTQSAMLSFNDIYRMLAILMALLIPAFLLLRRAGGGGGAAAAH